MGRLTIALSTVLVCLSAMTGAALGRERSEKDIKKLMGDKDGELQKRVNMAVQKGMKCLEGLQSPDGTWRGVWGNFKPPHNYPMGETALCLLALLKSGLHRSDEKIQKGFAWLRKQPLKKTYEVGILLMAIEALHAKQEPAPVDPKALTVVARGKVKPSPQDKDWMRQCVDFLLRVRVSSQRILGKDTGKALAHKDVWHYPSTTGDHSNTQFALLGLKSAAKCGIDIPPEVWHNTLLHFLEIQEKDGPAVPRWRVSTDKKDNRYVVFKRPTGVPDHARGWAYAATKYPKTGISDPLGATTGSMTCVGVSSLAIALSELGRNCPLDLKPKAEQAIWDGIAWLNYHWKIEENPRHPEQRWHYYYLYGLERVGVLTWQRTIGKHDWYRKGAEYLIESQLGSGGWDCPVCNGILNNTCFALLFLTRATVPGKTVISGGVHRRKR
ncbi:MAG: prenyltransferase/squalene oxidase repeat-containing protein [Planctomycetota bacterium]